MSVSMSAFDLLRLGLTHAEMDRDRILILNYVYVSVCIYICVNICVCMYIYAHVCTCIYRYVYICGMGDLTYTNKDTLKSYPW